jgi:hypothetical protein
MLRTVALSMVMIGLGQGASDGPKGGIAEKVRQDRPLAKVSTEALVDRLMEESAEGIGSQTTSWASGFLAIDEEPRLGGGMLGVAKPKASPVMQELVRRGVAALPVLIDHLSDARPTKLIVGDGFTGKWFSDEYDSRFGDPKKQPPGVNLADRVDLGRSFDRYTLKVGDLCYVAVGQIVNRGLLATRYQPSLCLVVNSPVQTPALAAAVKADWGGLTPEEHERSLRQDALDLAYGAASNALVRLLYYYPRSGEALVLQMLDRPFYDRELVFDFFHEKLVAGDPKDWDRLLSDFRKTHGEANYRGLLWVLNWASTFPKSQRDESREKSKKVADDLLERYFPWFDTASPPFLDAVDFDDLQWLIERLGPSPRFDRAILDAFNRCLTMTPRSVNDLLARGELARVCINRLGEQIPRQRSIAFFEGQIQQLLKARADPENEQWVAGIDQKIERGRKTLVRLKKDEAK